MAPQFEVIEERLKSFFCQLQAESEILDRIIYKNKNQHRRCSYFQYLLKVHRDLKLLHSIHMDELLDSCFYVITGRKAKQKANLLESLRKSKSESGKPNFMLRLLGAARLLSEMVEPMLKAAVEISTLLARSFFMGFSLMNLALLARLRVLVQQMLLDVISVFNEVSSIAQKKQSIKITQDGIEVFREYYPAIQAFVTLEGVWKTDKFVLVESISKGGIRHQDRSSEGGQIPLGTSVQYQSVETLLGGDELHRREIDADNNGEKSAHNVKRKRLESPSTFLNETNGSETGDSLLDVMPLDVNIALGGSSLASSSTPVGSTTQELKPEFVSNKRVAFVSVKPPTFNPSASNAVTFQVNKSESKGLDDKENQLFGLVNGEDFKESLF